MRPIPEALKVLAKATVKFFGSRKDLILMEAIIKYDCIEEERLEKILKFDRPLLQSQISNLIRERMVHKRTKPFQEAQSGKTKLVVYYFVNYKSLVDIVHFKIYRMRTALQDRISKGDEKGKSFFKCSDSTCGAEFRELQARELFHPGKNLFICVFCQNLVEENSGCGGEENISLRMAKFNEYTEPLLRLAQAASAFSVEEEPEPDWTPESGDPVTVHIVRSETAPDTQEDYSEAPMEISASVEIERDPLNHFQRTSLNLNPTPSLAFGSMSQNLSISDQDPKAPIFPMRTEVLIKNEGASGPSSEVSELKILRMLESYNNYSEETDRVECMSDDSDDCEDIDDSNNFSEALSLESVQDTFD